MTKKTKRIIANFLVCVTTMMALQLISGHWWIVLIGVPFGLWNYYDGATRNSLAA